MDMRKGSKVGMEVRKRVDVIIPVYRPGQKVCPASADAVASDIPGKPDYCDEYGTILLERQRL